MTIRVKDYEALPQRILAILRKMYVNFPGERRTDKTLIIIDGRM